MMSAPCARPHPARSKYPDSAASTGEPGPTVCTLWHAPCLPPPHRPWPQPPQANASWWHHYPRMPYHELFHRATTADDNAETAVFLLIYPYLYVLIGAKIHNIFQLSAHFELKITFLGIIFEPILGFFTSSIKHQTSSVQSLHAAA